MARHYHQGTYKVKNPQKYRGNLSNVTYRSSWELKFMREADRNPSFLSWSSEENVIPYISPVDGRPHRYFIDFYAEIRSRTGEVKKYLIEVKPDAQTRPPKYKRLTESVKEQIKTYAVNDAKWKAATEYCRQRGYEFIILTEEHLNVK